MVLYCLRGGLLLLGRLACEAQEDPAQVGYLTFSLWFAMHCSITAQDGRQPANIPTRKGMLGKAMGTRMRLNFARLRCAEIGLRHPKVRSFGSKTMTRSICIIGFCLLLAQPSGFLRVVPRERLYVSQPEPQWFGNPPNEIEHWSNENWLKSRFHFNFAEYSHGPERFGVLRVMNDDLVQGRRGFGAHGHQNMEILTFVVQGSLTHQDSHGNAETLERGGLQYMTAGTGITHSEQNFQDQPLRFVQCWVLPRRRGLRPRYGSIRDAIGVANQWSHVVSDVQSDVATPVKINQDCNVNVLQLKQGSSTLEVLADRQGYLLCVEGTAELAGVLLRRHDAAEVKGPSLLEATSDDALLLFFEMEQNSDQRWDI